MNPSPAQLRLAADVEEKGLEFEVRLGEKDYWRPPAGQHRDAFFYLCNKYELRLKPWTLPEPPKGMRWHNAEDFRREDLPHGYRPLLTDEDKRKGDEFRYVSGSSWEVSWDVLQGNKTDKLESCIYRTTRPLPPLPAEPEWVPWTFETRPRDMVWVYKKSYLTDRLIVSWGDELVGVACDDGRVARVSYTELFEKWLRRDGTPCGILRD